MLQFHHTPDHSPNASEDHIQNYTLFYKKADTNIHPFPSKPWFLRVCSTSLCENTVEKGEIARNEQFLLFPQCFLPI